MHRIAHHPNSQPIVCDSAFAVLELAIGWLRPCDRSLLIIQLLLHGTFFVRYGTENKGILVNCPILQVIEVIVMYSYNVIGLIDSKGGRGHANRIQMIGF